MAQVNEFPLLNNTSNLSRIKIEQLKGLSSITMISDIKPLKFLHLEKMNQISIEDYKAFIGHKTLEQITSGYSGRKKCNEVNELLGLDNVTYKPFWEEREF